MKDKDSKLLYIIDDVLDEFRTGFFTMGLVHGAAFGTIFAVSLDVVNASYTQHFLFFSLLLSLGGAIYIFYEACELYFYGENQLKAWITFAAISAVLGYLTLTSSIINDDYRYFLALVFAAWIVNCMVLAAAKADKLRRRLKILKENGSE